MGRTRYARVKRKRVAKRGDTHVNRTIADSLACRIQGLGPEEHFALYDAVRGGRPALSLAYFQHAYACGNGALSEDERAPYIIEEPHTARDETHSLPHYMGGGKGDAKQGAAPDDARSPQIFGLHPPKRGKLKKRGAAKKDAKRKKVVRFFAPEEDDDDANATATATTENNSETSALEYIKTSFGSATSVTGNDAPDRIKESLHLKGTQYSYPDPDTGRRNTVKHMSAKVRSGRALMKEDEYHIDTSTPAQQRDIDRCLDDLSRVTVPPPIIDSPDSHMIRIGGKVTASDIEYEKHAVGGYSILRVLHPKYAHWLLSNLENRGFHQFMDFLQPILNITPVSFRPLYTFADFMWTCEHMGGVPWTFSFSPQTKIDTWGAPCPLYSIRFRFNTYTEQQQESRIKECAAEEELIQKKSDLVDVTQDYITCLVHLGMKARSITEAESVDTIEAARTHTGFEIVIANAQFEIMLQ